MIQSNLKFISKVHQNVIILIDLTIKWKMELKVSACKLRLIGENIFNDKYAVIGYKVCLPRRNSLKSL